MKTAVELFAEQIQEQLNMFFPGATLDNLMIERAKLKEKEQIIMAYKADLYPCSDEDAEKYYNETFKQEEK